MSVKDFSQKYSLVFFYSTIILLAISILLGISTIGGNKKLENNGGEQRNQIEVYDRNQQQTDTNKFNGQNQDAPQEPQAGQGEATPSN